jgi:hypothetical protein
LAAWLITHAPDNPNPLETTFQTLRSRCVNQIESKHASYLRGGAIRRINQTFD